MPKYPRAKPGSRIGHHPAVRWLSPHPGDQPSHIVNFDGGCWNNGKPNAYGAWAYCVRLPRSKEPLAVGSGLATGTLVTCNTAEWQGLIAGVQSLIGVGNVSRLLIRGDSQLIINQITGQWRARNHFEELCAAALNALEQLSVPWSAIWVPRAANQECDDLVELAARKRDCRLTDPCA